MEIAGLALASTSAAHELFNCGRRIYHRVKDEQKLSLVLRNLQMFNLEERKVQLEVNIRLAQDVLKSPTIDQEHKDRLEQNWKRIKEILIEIDGLLSKMIENSSWSPAATRARHDARDRLNDIGGVGAVSNAVQEFQAFVLAIRELNKGESPLFLSDNDFQILDSANRDTTLPENTFLGRGLLTTPLRGVPDTPQTFLFESKPYDISRKETVKKNIQILVQKLHQAEGQQGILQLIGFRDEPRISDTQGAFQLVFTYPSLGQTPKSLTSLLKTNPDKPSLNLRIGLCYDLATAVLQTMTLGLVHKNVRPENILLSSTKSFVHATHENTLDVFLVGWQYARQLEGGATNLKGETSLQRKVYQHPERQLVEAEKRYSMAHDVYSLGVCMIEILTWKSLLPAIESPTISDEFIAAFRSLDLEEDASEPFTRDAYQVQKTLISMCTQYIPVEAGEKMAVLVKDFLTCLNDQKDEDGQKDDNNEVQYQTPRDHKARRDAAVRFVDTALKMIRDIQTAI